MEKYNFQPEKNVDILMNFIEAKNHFVDEHLDFSTADIESSIFYGEHSIELIERESMIIAKGVYRIIDNELFRVMDGSPPRSIPLKKESGLFKIIGISK